MTKIAMHPLEFIVSGRVVDLQTFLWDHSCKVQEGGVLQRMYFYKMGVIEPRLQPVRCPSGSLHMPMFSQLNPPWIFSLFSYREMWGGFFGFFFYFTCRMKNRF